MILCSELSFLVFFFSAASDFYSRSEDARLSAVRANGASLAHAGLHRKVDNLCFVDATFGSNYS